MKLRLKNVLKEWLRNRKEYASYIIFLLVAILVSVVALNVFLEITEELRDGDLAPFDKAISTSIFSLRSEVVTKIFIGITELGSQWTYLIIIPLVAFLLKRKGHNWKISLQATLILLSSFFLNLLLKFLINRPRPLEENWLIEVTTGSLSYPSGHSMSAVVLYGFLIYLVFNFVKDKALKTTAIAFFVLLILAIGTSRVYLGVHFPSDVIAGFIAGLIWLFVCLLGIHTIALYRNKREESI